MVESTRGIRFFLDFLVFFLDFLDLSLTWLASALSVVARVDACICVCMCEVGAYGFVAW